MANRRVTTLCVHRDVARGSRGMCHSLDYATSMFPIEDDICGKVKQVISETDLDDRYVLQRLACGHWDTIEKEVANKHKRLSLSYDKLLPFQKDFINFAEKNNCKVICRDEMGTGKTAESLVLLDQNGNLFTADFTKYCIIVCLPGAVYQWNEEMDNFMSYMHPTGIEDLKLIPQTIFGTGQKINTSSLVLILPWSKLGDKKLMAQIEKVGVGGLIVDECHYYKDENSARTQNLIKLVKLAGHAAPKVFLSGTLTENRVTEMQTALNAIDPTNWSSKRIIHNMCVGDDYGRALGIAPWHRDRFNRITSKYMIGRTKAQVGIPLPFNKAGEFAPQMEYIWIDPREHQANAEIASMYDATLYDLEILLENPHPSSASIIGLMQQLRHHTGRMKILSAAMWIETWMMCNPGEKLAVGIHHKAVRESLVTLLKARKPLSMSDEDAKEKDEIEKKFKQPGNNLLICSILSAGTGRNFQFCKNAVILERQWNRSKEDQFSQRFHRIIKDADGRIKEHFTEEDMVTVYVLQAQRSFDEYFDYLVDLKGMIVDTTDENEEMPDINTMIQLARKVIQARKEWVGI